jgi:PAS domain S-box-containing protein
MSLTRNGQKAIDDAEDRLLVLLDTANDGILELDGSDRIALVNRMAEELFGYPATS